MRLIEFCGSVFFIVLLGSQGLAATLHVPSEYATIQDAVEAAASGDEILLAPGRYAGDGNTYIEVDGLSLSIRSESGPDVTTIDGEDSRWGLRFRTDAVDMVSIHGIEFTGLGGAVGSAILVQGSGEAIVEDCRFVRCTTPDYDPYGNGSGVVMVKDEVRSSFRRCEFSWNDAPFSPSGLRVASSGESTVEMCDFIANSTGAMDIEASSTAASLADCNFVNNGGALYALGGSVRISDCSFINNGSGILSRSQLTITGSTFARTRGILVVSGTLYAENTILNDGCPSVDLQANAPVTLVCCAVDSSFVSGWEHITLEGEQVWDDPLFCDPEVCGGFNDGGIDRYRLHADSPCVWWRSPCGVRIGSLDVGCGAAGIGACCIGDECVLAPEDACASAGGIFVGEGTTCEPSPCGAVPVVPMSWGTIKELFR
ncbi:MAG: right-handed parallel beta-helix repeat-containing protein [Candidatus Eisenbacteria bacterium]